MQGHGDSIARGEDGLTTLEWLLIVAAVAGLAALAVVLVQNLADDTAETVRNQSARRTAAVVAAEAINSAAKRDADQQPKGAKTYADWAEFYEAKCHRLEIIFIDAGIRIGYESKVGGTSPAGDNDPVMSSDIITGVPDETLPSFMTLSPASNKASAHCYVQR